MAVEKKTIGTHDTSRLKGLSDGIFGFAITLLVLELIENLHPESGKGLLKSLLDQWQAFLAFTIGFTTILVCWINHHGALEYFGML